MFIRRHLIDASITFVRDVQIVLPTTSFITMIVFFFVFVFYSMDCSLNSYSDELKHFVFPT